MPKTAKPLSTGRLEKLLRDARPGRYSDGDGLYLEIMPSGSCHWLLRIQANGKRHEFGLGAVRHVTLAQAREKALGHRRLLTSGGDPTIRGRVKPQAKPTFKQAALEFIAEHTKNLTNTKSKTQWTTTMEQYVFPLIGDLSVDRIEPRDVMRTLEPIWTTIPVTARKLRQRIGKILDWAKLKGIEKGTTQLMLSAAETDYQRRPER